ncbi:leucine-rich repeat domain-containing protein [Bengtsoniella intestinalis]|uniref:leucine-rich repeat domain-containing protein n=1 Tax=Bengtsoniella intestinalis TaxID=3073143 RepID=UPI00391F5BD0
MTKMFQDFEIWRNDTEATIKRYMGNEAEVTIPSEIEGVEVTKIGAYAFYDCTNLTCVTIPEGVLEIEHDAFKGCTSLTQVVDFNQKITITPSAFSGCTGLVGRRGFLIVAGVLLKYSGKDAAVTIPKSVTEVAPHAFFGATCMSKIIIPESVQEIGKSAFYYCPMLEYIVFSDEEIALDGMRLESYVKFDTPHGPVEQLEWSFDD